jgi:hypothetical protein
MSMSGNGQVSTPASTLAQADSTAAVAEAERLISIERRLLSLIQWVVFGGVILLTVGAGALSWSHLTHIASPRPRWARRGHGRATIMPDLTEPTGSRTPLTCANVSGDHLASSAGASPSAS